MDNNAVHYQKSIRNILIILLVVVAFSVLRELSHLLIPLALAGLLTILNLPLISLLERWKFPRVLITLVAASLSIAIVWALVRLISGTAEQIVRESDVLARQFSNKISLAIGWLGSNIPGLDAQVIREELDLFLLPRNITAVIGSVLGTLGGFGSSSVLFAVYYLILISGATGYHGYMDYVVGAGGDGRTRRVWVETQESITAYMGIKTIISLATGTTAGLICWAFGLQFALFWAFMAFLLNYIPSIGSILATALPLFMAIIQFDSLGAILALGILLGLSQFVIGSILDPMIMGNRLRLNTVAVIFGLLFWGYIWGIPGMLLSVPLMVMMRLMLELSDDLSIFARILGNPPRRKSAKPPLAMRIIGKRLDSSKEVSEVSDEGNQESGDEGI